MFYFCSDTKLLLELNRVFRLRGYFDLVNNSYVPVIFDLHLQMSLDLIRKLTFNHFCSNVLIDCIYVLGSCNNKGGKIKFY